MTENGEKLCYLRLLLPRTFILVGPHQGKHTRRMQCIQRVKVGYYCYQPIYAEMIYYNNTTYEVERAQMVAECYGYELTYPGLAYLTDDYVTHRMTINATDSNKYFVSTNAYRSDRVICIGGGYFLVDFYFKFNNKNYFETINMEVYHDDLAGS